MIISHKHKFIFLKTRKTAGTSIEIWLQSQCGTNDIVTPLFPAERDHISRNDKGWFNPLPEILRHCYSPDRKLYSLRRSLGDLMRRRRYYNHISGRLVRSRVSTSVWTSYWKWCVERNPLEKATSHYFMLRANGYSDLSPAEYLLRFSLPMNYPMYCDYDGTPLVDQILNYGKLREELVALSTRLGIEFNDLGPRAKANYRDNRGSYSEIFNEAQIAYIYRTFERELLILDRVGAPN